ncbi:MAG TPA: DUF2845 domain-containing protein [Steroidobacteraceae bacterium]
MKFKPVLLLLAGLAAAPHASAETLRCGSALIKVGATAGYVLEKCGEPQSRTQISEPVRARRPNGTTYVTGTTMVDVWRYDRGSRKFPAVLTFREGVLKKIEYEK